MVQFKSYFGSHFSSVRVFLARLAARVLNFIFGSARLGPARGLTARGGSQLVKIRLVLPLHLGSVYQSARPKRLFRQKFRLILVTLLANFMKVYCKHFSLINVIV